MELNGLKRLNRMLSLNDLLIFYHPHSTKFLVLLINHRLSVKLEDALYRILLIPGYFLGYLNLILFLEKIDF